MFTKKQLIEIMLRPVPMPEAEHEHITREYLKKPEDQFIEVFRRETNLDIRPVGHNFWIVKY